MVLVNVLYSQVQAQAALACPVEFLKMVQGYKGNDKGTISNGETGKKSKKSKKEKKEKVKGD